MAQLGGVASVEVGKRIGPDLPELASSPRAEHKSQLTAPFFAAAINTEAI